MSTDPLASKSQLSGRVIYLREDTYEALKAVRLPDETFNDTILRILAITDEDKGANQPCPT